MANKRPLVLDDLGGGAGAIREAGDGECEALIGSPYCTYGGTANAITLTVNDLLGTPSAYVAGAQYRFRATTANGPGGTTINVAGLGDKTAVTVTGAALPAGYIRTDVDTVITYDVSIDSFVVGRELERGSNANGTYVRSSDGEISYIIQTTDGTGWASSAYGSTGLSRHQKTITLPAGAVAGTGATAGSGQDQSQWVWIGSASIGATTVLIQLFSSTASISSVSLRITIVARWY